MQNKVMKMKRLCALILFLALACTLLPFQVAAAGGAAWDGKTIDVSWYNTTDTEFEISTPAQLMGLAAIVNGIYNTDITTVIGDKSVIVDNVAGGMVSGGSNLSTDTYHYGADSFMGKTIFLTSDLDMGGMYDSASDTWSGPNYMPIGGQYLITPNDSTTKLSSSFCGTLDGQGHTVYNIYCSRRCTTGNYGDGQSVGLIGRLGVHDNDPDELRPTDPTVKNIAVTGYIYANRSVGGIVGKIGKTSYNSGDSSTGGIIENCANFATVSNTDAKGVGGIVGAGWNGGVVRNCYNAGSVISSYTCPTGGISGSNEIAIENCYNIGRISAAWDSYAMAIGTNNGGGNKTDNCYWLTGTAPGGGYYGANKGTVTELSAEEMKSESFVTKLGDAFVSDTNGINGGFPVLVWQAKSTSEKAGFSDVSASAWYYGAVNYAVSTGLFNGTSDTTFSPDTTMTRAMFVTIMGRLSGADVSGYTMGNFSDVPVNEWYAKSVNWAAATELVTGTEIGQFSPHAPISLEAMALVLYRYSGETVTGSALPVNAGAVSGWAEDAMIWAQARNLFAEVGGTLSAQGPATRAQVAAVLMNFGK